MLAALKRLRWRTMLFAAAVFLVGVADLAGTVDLQAVLLMLGVPEGRVGGLVSLLGLLVAVLRWITTGPLVAPQEDP